MVTYMLQVKFDFRFIILIKPTLNLIPFVSQP